VPTRFECGVPFHKFWITPSSSVTLTTMWIVDVGQKLASSDIDFMDFSHNRQTNIETLQCKLTTPILRDLHWLLVWQCINYKTAYLLASLQFFEQLNTHLHISGLSDAFNTGTSSSTVCRSPTLRHHIICDLPVTDFIVSQWYQLSMFGQQYETR